MKKIKTGCDVENCMLCNLCVPEWKMAVLLHRKNFEVQKGELIFKEGDKMNGIFFVHQGTVKVHKKWLGDKELIVRFAKTGQILGHRGLGMDNYYPVSATALDKTTLCYIDLDFFDASLKINNFFLYELMRFFADELKESEMNMRNLAHMSVMGRTAQAILNLKEKFGTDTTHTLHIELSRQDFASYVGTTYETLFRMMNEMAEAGAIQVKGKKIRIINEKKLIQYTT